MTTNRPVLLLGIDAGNPALLRRYAGEGHLPNLTHVIASGRTAPVEHERGLFVGSIWPTAMTGLSADRHGFYTGIRHAPHSYDYVPAGVIGDPFWVDVSNAGHRVAVIDPPFFPARHDITAEHIVEWGCHDRYYGPSSSPSELLELVLDSVGAHPIGMVEHTYERFAPCDWIHTDGRVRTLEQTQSLIDTIRDALQMRIELSTWMLDRGPFDLFVDVVAETHCAGHQLWSLHDPSHPDHDPEMLSKLGGDPLLPIYRQLDELVGIHLERLGSDGVAYVFVSHGMRNHFDGTKVLDEILWRLDQKYRGAPTPWIGSRTRTVSRAAGHVTQLRGRRRAQLLGALAHRVFRSRSIEPTDPSAIPHPAERLWYQLENNTVCGAVRFNRLGREPRGTLDDGLLEHAERWLVDELEAIVNVDSGEPAIDTAYLADQLYRRRRDDGLPDLMVDWNHRQPIDRVWSPSIGLISAPYHGLRTGDHDRFGELHVLGAGVSSGTRTMIRGVDLASTVAAASGVFLKDRDGQVVDDLVPMADRSVLTGGAPTLDRAEPVQWKVPGASAIEVSALRRSIIELRQELNGLQTAHHETRIAAEAAVRQSNLNADILATTSWIAGQCVEERALISVIVPTRNRASLLHSAITSIVGQSYRHLEVLVVDDGSTDTTHDVLASIDDGRLRVIRNETPFGEGAARNVGLDHANGEIVCFLDDDNTFDPAWLRSIAWHFDGREESRLVYGARLVDDVRRHHHHVSGGHPALELNDWNRDVFHDRCLIDVNVIAHRRSDVRFDRDLPLFADWDYLLHLTRDDDPDRLSVIAAHYTTGQPDRATFRLRPRHDELYDLVRTRHRRPE